MSSRTKNYIGLAVTVIIFILIIALKFYLGNSFYYWIKRYCKFLICKNTDIMGQPEISKLKQPATFLECGCLF